MEFQRARVVRDIMSIETWAPRTTETAHEWLQSWIAGLARDYGFRGWREEFVPYVARHDVPREGRVDIVWVGEGYIVAAFEVDRTVKQASIAKLQELETERFIVSYTSRADLWAKRVRRYGSALTDSNIAVLAPLAFRALVGGRGKRYHIATGPPPAPTGRR